MKFFIAIKLLLFLLFGFIGTLDVQAGPPIPRRMAALGDSMTEAILADYAFESGIKTGEVLSLAKYLKIENKDERILAFREDFSAYGKSWSTGYDSRSLVFSHLQRLRQVNGALEAYNFAVAGSDSFDLGDQVARLLDYQRHHHLKFDYVTVLLGANDLGSTDLEGITTPHQYIQNFEAGLRKILDANSKVAILLSGMPNIFEIFDATAEVVIAKGFGQKMTCDETRKMIYGKYPVFDGTRGEHFLWIESVYLQYHQGLENLAQRLSEEYPEAHLKFTGEIRTMQNPIKVISLDCFHPSEWGQAELAELTWSLGFWPDL